MKKVALIVVIILVAIGLWWFLGQRHASAPTSEVKVTPTVSKPDPSNATFQFEDGPVTLKDGSASMSITPNSAATQETAITGDLAYGDLNNDGKNDTALLLVQDSGGSGVFLYVAAYLSGVVQYKGSNAVFIGDRVTPKSISIDKGVINVSYLDRKSTEPMAAEPTVLTTHHYIVRSGILEEE